jgi:hypothetical protein
MSSSQIDFRTLQARRVTATETTLTVDLVDGRTIAVPVAWYPRLLHATPGERSRTELIGEGEGIRWPDLDEDVSVASLLLGRPSQESESSLQRWLDTRHRAP